MKPSYSRHHRWAGYEAKLGLPSKFSQRWPFVYAHGKAEDLLGEAKEAAGEWGDPDIFHASVPLSRFNVGVHDVEFLGQNATAYIWNDRGMKGGLIVIDNDRSGGQYAKAEFNKHLSSRRASRQRPPRNPRKPQGRRAGWFPTPEGFIKQMDEIKVTLKDMENSVPFRSPVVHKSFRDLYRAFDIMEKNMVQEMKVREELKSLGGLYASSAARVTARHLQAARPDSDDRYKTNVKEVRSLLKKIDTLVTKHGREQGSNTQDWGYTGDMSHVSQLLEEVERFLNSSR